MFIPIHAKADITEGEGAKKGKFTPAQNAQLVAWSLSSKTGILDCLGKCEAYPTTYNIVDNKATINFNKGYVVICGRLVECEQNTKFEINTNLYTSGKIVLRYNLSASKEKEFEVAVVTGALRDDDLNENTFTGIHEFELYEFSVSGSVLTLTRTNTNYVPNIGGKLSQFEASLKDEGKPLHGYDDSKGTIEERLTDLGFKKGVVTMIATPVVSGNIVEVSKMGCWIVIKIPALKINFGEGSNNVKTRTICKISNISLEKDIHIYTHKFVDSSNTRYFDFILKTNGDIVVQLTAGNSLINYQSPNIYKIRTTNDRYFAPENFV